MSALLGIFSLVTLVGTAVLLDKKNISKFGIMALTAGFLVVNVCAYVLVLPGCL